MNALARVGIKPSAVVGHSSGEIAAAYTAGIVSLSEAITVAYYRGYIIRNEEGRGGMTAVGLGAKETLMSLTDGAVIAAENSPNSCTVAGGLDQLEAALLVIRAWNPEVLARRLNVEMAYHSGQCWGTKHYPHIGG